MKMLKQQDQKVNYIHEGSNNHPCGLVGKLFVEN